MNCQKVGFVRSLTEEGRTARRVQAVLKNNTNEKSDYLSTASSKQLNAPNNKKFPVRDEGKIIRQQKT